MLCIYIIHSRHSQEQFCRHCLVILQQQLSFEPAKVKARGPPSEEDSSIGAQLMRLRDPSTGQALADEYLLPQMSVLFWAGFDTTGNTMAWTLYCISQHPQVRCS